MVFHPPPHYREEVYLNSFFIFSQRISVLLFGLFYLKLIKHDLEYFTLPLYSMSSLKFVFYYHLCILIMFPAANIITRPCFSNGFLFLLSTNWNLPSKLSKTPCCRLLILLAAFSMIHTLSCESFLPSGRQTLSFFFKFLSLQLLILFFFLERPVLGPEICHKMHSLSCNKKQL